VGWAGGHVHPTPSRGHHAPGVGGICAYVDRDISHAIVLAHSNLLPGEMDAYRLSRQCSQFSCDIPALTRAAATVAVVDVKRCLTIAIGITRHRQLLPSVPTCRVYRLYTRLEMRLATVCKRKDKNNENKAVIDR